MSRKKKSRRSGFTRAFVVALLSLLVISLLLVLPFRWLAPPTTAFILQARWTGLGSGQPCSDINRQWIDWPMISPQMALAVIAAEDQRFPQHWGLDPQAISSALQDRSENGRVRGGSTLTQQLVKNLYLWPGQSWSRKAIEAWLTLLVEFSWSKQRILETYLNVVQFGACTFGVEAASRQFFHLDSQNITAWQAARLAAVLPNPVRLRADGSSEYLQQRTRWILKQMGLLGGTAYLRNL